MDIQRASFSDASPDTGYVAVTLRNGKPDFSGLATAAFGTRSPGRTPGTGDGIFARWSWDGTQLSAEVDRYGFYSLFYAVDGNRVRISPSLWQLASMGCDLTPDRRALQVFDRLGIFINNDTPFEGIKVLPPGGKLTWRGGKVTVEAPPVTARTADVTRDQAVEGFIELFRKSIARTLDAWDGPIVLPLSGGRDSRHILLELVRQGRRPDACVTFHHGGNRWNAEVKAARAICEAVGVRHDVVGNPRSRPSDSFRAIGLTQLCADEHAQMLPMHDYLLDRPTVAVYDGVAGDILTNPDDDAEAFLGLARAGDFAEIARRMIAGHGKAISLDDDGPGAGALYSPGADDATIAYVAQAIAAYADAPDPYQMFWLLHRTRREISFVARGIMSPARAVFAPYLDQDFVEFGLSLPFSVTGDQKLHDDAISRAYPDFAAVPFENGFTDDRFRASPVHHKLRSIRDITRIARFLAPDDPVGDIRILLGRGRTLAPGPNMMYHIHRRMVEGLTPQRANDFAALAGRLAANRPRQMVSDSYRPSASGSTGA